MKTSNSRRVRSWEVARVRSCAWLTAGILVAAGCDGGLQPVGGGPGSDAPWQSDAPAEDLWQYAPAEARCESYTDPDGVEWFIAGATSYFFGDYKVADDGTVHGTEHWLLAANATWREAGEDDCMVTWAVNGTVGDPVCNSCDYSIAVEAQVVDSQTTCPRGLIVNEETWAVEYDISVFPDGVTQFRYLESGNLLGEGWQDGERITYLTSSRCMWF